MKKLEKYITDERTGLKYELIGDYYFIAGDEPEEYHPIGIWGQRRLRYLREHKRLLYSQLLSSSKLNGHLANINEQAENMFGLLIKQMAESENVTEQLKAENQMEWIKKMNCIKIAVQDIINAELIFN